MAEAQSWDSVFFLLLYHSETSGWYIKVLVPHIYFSRIYFSQDIFNTNIYNNFGKKCHNNGKYSFLFCLESFIFCIKLKFFSIKLKVFSSAELSASRYNNDQAEIDNLLKKKGEGFQIYSREVWHKSSEWLLWGGSKVSIFVVSISSLLLQGERYD